MKNLIIYYSKTSNTETVAKEISKAVDGEIKKIELSKEISFLWAGFTALTGQNAIIKEIDLNVEDYDNIFIGSPVWAGKSSTPINTFLSRVDLTGKNTYIFITQADVKMPSSVFESIKARIEAKGGKVTDCLFVHTDMKNPLTSEQATVPVAEWISKNIPNFRKL